MAKVYCQGVEVKLPPSVRAAVTFVILGLLWWGYDALREPTAQASPPERPREPYVASDTRLAPDERLRVLIVPHELGKHFDMRCLLYDGPRGAQLVCPNATQEQLQEAMER